MPSGDGGWAELSSQNERVIMQGERDYGPVLPAPSEWADLASSRERLLEASDPLFELASRSHASTGMRLVTGAA
jgi:hypothetical protein